MKGRVDWVWLFLNPKGRLTRLPYFLAMLLIMVVSGMFIYHHLMSSMPLNFADPWSTPGLMELASFITVVTMWPMIALSTKRAADIGIPPIVGGLVVLFGVLVVAAMSLVPGADGPNRYGRGRNEPPRS